MFSGPDIVSPPEPIFHPACQKVERNAVACFHQSIPKGKRVVKDGIVGEVAHGKAIDPVDRTWMRGACGVYAFDLKLAGKHGSGEEREQRRVDRYGLHRAGELSGPSVATEDRDRG
jgi:hypothetical protein